VKDTLCVGFAITVVDPGRKGDDIYKRGRGRGRPSTAWRVRVDTTERLLRAVVIQTGTTAVVIHTGTTWHRDRDGVVRWQSGKRTGEVWEHDEGSTWVRGHGPQARGALLAARALERQR
jgi:hypothetical protein